MDYLQTALEAAWICAVFISLDYFVGLGVASLLVPEEWHKHALLMPLLLGWCVLVLALVFINMLLPVQVGVYVVIAGALALNVLAVLRKAVRVGDWRSALLPLLLALGLVILALLPHIVQRSLGLIVLNQDEEEYYPVANFLLLYPANLDAHLWAGAFFKFLPWGWGVPYLVASVSTISGLPTFLTYVSTNYLLLGLSVPAWYVLFVETLGLSKREAVAALCFYCLLGLPLWFAAYGYGTQMSSLVTIPLGVAAVAAALDRGGTRRVVLAGIVISAGLVSFYRGIALQYFFLIGSVVLIVLAQKRSLRPLIRGLGVLLAAIVSGLPAHWTAGNWFVAAGALSNPQALDISGGWNLNYFQPASVMLGLQPFPIAVDDENLGPLAGLDYPAVPLAEAIAWILIVIAVFGLIKSSRRRPLVAGVVLGTVLSLGFNRLVLNYPYGWVKLMPVAAAIVYALVAGSAAGLVQSAKRLLGQWGTRSTVLGLTALFSATMLLLAFDNYEAVWSNAIGWGQSVPSYLPERLRDVRQLIPPGSKLFVSGHFDYPVPEDRLHTRQDMLGMRSEQEQRRFWGTRARSIAMTELLPVNTYAWMNDGLIFSRYRRLLDDESYDYYLLGSDNDPRLEGLDRGDAVWSESGLSLYAAKGVVRKSPWLIMKERGSLGVGKQDPLSISVSPSEISAVGAALAPAGSGTGRLRLGILSFGQSEVVISSQSFSKKLVLDEGLTWYSTPDIALPSSLSVTSQQSIGLVSIRLLAAGTEETEFTPRRELGYFLYASSTLINPDEWLTDPFRGSKPGSA